MEITPFLHFDITEKILGAIRKVYGKLGSGFSDSVYQNILARELSKTDLHVINGYPISMKYDGAVIG